MDSLSTIHKIRAVKYRKQQFVSSLVLYSLTTMSCSLLVFSPFWYPPLRAAVSVFLFVSFPKVVSLFLSAKVVFIVGNLIVIFLVGEFKTCTVPHRSQARGAETGENVKLNLHRIQLAREMRPIKVDRCEPVNGDSGDLGAQSHQMISVALQPKSTNRVTVRHEKTSVQRKGWSEEKDQREELMSGEKDLNKMADDFIARVNRQRRLEAELYKY